MDTADNRRRLTSEMTLTQKASLMSGANFWNTESLDQPRVPSIMLTDGPHGLRKQGGAADHLGLNASLPATCFPTAAGIANTWDLTLAQRIGEALGAEAAAEEVGVLLGPGLNIKRNPLAGRNFEYFSEDPYLSGALAAAMIRGIQSQGVGASAKHFAVNAQETHRMSIDEVVDERALHEIHLEGFRIAVIEGEPWTVMSSYNKVNGTYANEHRELLDDILRQQWGFDGLVVTDWGGNNDRLAGLVAGNALEMPSADGVTDQEIVAAIEAGDLNESVLDQRVDEVLTLAARVGATSPMADAAQRAMHDRHHELAVEAARRSAVLLRNDNAALPLGVESGRIAVIGDFAETPRYQGAGSSLVKPTRVDSPLESLRATDLDIVGFEPGFSRRDGRSTTKRRRALDLARKADTVLVFLGLDESAEAEGVDRAHMRLAANQLDLVNDLLALNTRIVVVLAGGAPVELPFADDVDAILHGYLGGQGGGRAIADLLTGAANPGGRLAESYPLTYDDVPSAAHFAEFEATAEHRESIYVGYRYYDKVGAPVRYPFGHGLSYTQFEYSDFRADARVAAIKVRNSGYLAGTEVVQLYVEAPDKAEGEIRAARELAGFATVTLEQGESATVEIPLREHAFSVYDTQERQWRTVGGTYTVLAGASSRDILLAAALHIDGQPLPQVERALAPYATGHVADVTPGQFGDLLGRPLPPRDWSRSEPLTRASIIAQCQGRGGFASVLHGGVTASARVLMALGRVNAANNTHFVLDLPFRSVARMSAGRMDDAMLDGLLTMVDGSFWRGSRDLLSSWRAHRRRARTVHHHHHPVPKEG
ncbi:glycoside hydrolase family 3 C-terminal domain-containing protein [Demequina flava]|uniref:glycoside hydrolase family 3 C-terminal domain-containing protein n=1 Tax=Demequina flava TaxID=1095025 RepID=UPI0009E5B310|nr:glycoside hydrolase family 3 C-terminal domain-containing protein [Demequina flava]